MPCSPVYTGSLYPCDLRDAEWAHLAPRGLLWRLGQLAVLGLVFGAAYLLALRLAGVRVSSLLTSPRGQRAT